MTSAQDRPRRRRRARTSAATPGDHKGQVSEVGTDLETSAFNSTGAATSTGAANAKQDNPKQDNPKQDNAGQDSAKRDKPKRDNPKRETAGRREDTGRGSGRESDRGWRELAGSSPSQVGLGGALRARDVARPSAADLAAAERSVVVVRRQWQPPED